jgi:tetratricopeptide (TPR) repeat protein
MMQRFLFMVFGLVLAATLGAALMLDDLELAYRAYQAGDYVVALQHYDAALSSTTDPGKVAFDQGATLAAAERHAEAALAFAQALEDATGLRRIKAAYAQGTELTHVAAGLTGRRAITLLQQALQSFGVAIREAEAANSVDQPEAVKWKMNAEHNRLIAQTLLTKKQQEPEPPAPSIADRDSDFMELLRNLRGNGTSQPMQPGRTVPAPGEQSAGGARTETSEAQAGKGNLPPLLDESKSEPISPDEAVRRLDLALQRINKPLGTPSIKPGAKDW